MQLFRGLAAFPITPTDANGHVDTEGLSRIVERLGSAGVDSVGLLGSTGGYAYLRREERRRAVEAAVSCLGGRVPLMVGVGAMRTDEAQALTRDAEACGADGLLLAPISYTPLTETEVLEHFRAVGSASDLPLCVYNNPTTTHFTFTEALIGRVAALPTAAAVKMPLPADGGFAAEIAGLRAVVRPGFTIGYSGDVGMAESLLAGADGFHSVIAGLLPVPALALVRAAMAGDAVEARRIDELFAPVWTLFRGHGSLRVMHALAAILGLAEAAPPRPLLGLEAGPRRELERVVAPLAHFGGA